MAEKVEVPTTLDKLKPFSSNLFTDIENEPRAINSQSNQLVEPIYLAWEAVQSGRINDSDVIYTLKSPQNFFEKLAPIKSRHTTERRISGLGEKIGMFLGIERYHEEVGIQKVYKKGRQAGKNKFVPSGEWVLFESDDYSETYIHRDILNELNNLNGDEVPQDVRFHATTSQVMKAVSEDGALVCSSEILNNGKSLINGERMYSRKGHPNVFVDPDQILWSYGRPRWFDQFGVAFGVSMEDQKKYLKLFGERVEYAGSDGFEIGSKVPMGNIRVISAPASHLDEVRAWASVNCPSAKVISREAMKLKFRK